MMDYEAVRTLYRQRGFGGRVGCGHHPAILVIDLARSWLDEGSLLGSDLGEVVKNTCRVLDAGRTAHVPIFFTTMSVDPEQKEAVGPFGKKQLYLTQGRCLERGSPWVALDPTLNRRPDEILIEKPRYSAFWETPLLSYLLARHVDTVIITGCSTSGCIRSTAESALNYNFHTIVVKEAVGDRSLTAHACNLIDIDLRFADVTSLEDVLNYLDRCTAS